MDNFAVIKISYTPTIDTETIVVETNNPCHLLLSWTLNPPLRHETSRIERGLAIPWNTYFCLNALTSVEQDEAGDTLTHTFLIIDWPHCETRYLVLSGTVGANPSPSVSAIYKHHHYFPPYILLTSYNLGETSAYRFTAGTRTGQTFTLSVPATIAQIKVMLNRRGSPGQITASIRATDPSDHPDLPDLVSATFNGNSVIVYPGKEWITIDLTHLPYSPAKYAIVLHAPSGGPGIDIGWWGDASSPTYLLGNFERGYNGAGTWSAILTRDAMFEVWGYLL